MNDKDIEFIKVLMRNPEATDQEVANKLKISRSAVAKRRTKLDKEICYFTSPHPNKIKYRLVSGFFKFTPPLAFKDLVPFAKKFAKDDNCLSLWIRKISSDAYGICFQYIKDSEIPDSQLFDEWTQKLKKTFGPDFVGYSLATPTYTFKMLGRIFDPLS